MADQLETDASLMHFTVHFTAIFYQYNISQQARQLISERSRALKYARARSKNRFHTA